MSGNTVLPADQGKYCDSKRKQSYNNTWNSHTQQLQAKEKEEQDHTPGRK